MQALEKTFVAAAGLLLAVGLLMVFSASITSRPTRFEEIYLSRQLVALGIAVAAGVVTALVPAQVWQRAAPGLLLAVTVLLGAVLVPSIGTSVNGARRWLRLGGLTVQPSELAKLALPLYLCAVATRDGRTHAVSWRMATRLVLPTLLVLGLVVLEPDLGTALFLAATGALALFLSGWPVRWFLLAGVALVPLTIVVGTLRPYQWERVRGFVAAWRDFDAAPYQVRQSLITVGSGGVAGVGLGHGQQKLSYLPEANTDFVFAVIGEELGLVGTLGVLLLFASLYGLGVRLLAGQPRGGFEHAAGLTILTGLVLQAAMNMAVVLALVPPKGISLPLVSYGGSNLVASLGALGLVLSLTRGSRPQPECAGSR